MKVPVSPFTGKPMRMLFEPEKMKYRGEEYDCIYISFRDDAEGEGYTTTESDTSWYNPHLLHHHGTKCICNHTPRLGISSSPVRRPPAWAFPLMD